MLLRHFASMHYTEIDLTELEKVISLKIRDAEKMKKVSTQGIALDKAIKWIPYLWTIVNPFTDL